jgi:hypothetical protein
VLDNCEHLLEGAAALAEVLERSCERLVILATSREGLRIEGEYLVPVPPLGVPGVDAGLETTVGAEAVRLFAERAAAVKPDFAVREENAAAVAAVVRRLDGIALAIELAAARVPAMTPAELARRLERSFAVLAAGRRDAAGRHQTLRAAIDWSFELLAEPEQRLLARLAVFVGGAPAARAWTGTKPSPTPSRRPPRPSENSSQARRCARPAGLICPRRTCPVTVPGVAEGDLLLVDIQPAYDGHRDLLKLRRGARAPANCLCGPW